MKKILVLLFTVYISVGAANAQVEFGTASFYGIEFNGKPTASGEIYSQNKLTAAHKTLPLGTIVKVTNAQNNKSVFVKINDRGPFIKGRIIDLSTKAAELLGYRNRGTAYVKIEIVKPDSIPSDLIQASENIAQQNGFKEYSTTDSLTTNTSSKKDNSSNNNSNDRVEQTTAAITLPASIPPPPIEIKEANSNGITNRSPYFIINKLDKSNSGFYGLQLGVFSDISIIFILIEELESKYKQTLVAQEILLEGKKVYKLFIGKFQNRAYADALKLVLSDKYKDAFVVKYE